MLFRKMQVIGILNSQDEITNGLASSETYLLQTCSLFRSFLLYIKNIEYFCCMLIFNVLCFERQTGFEPATFGLGSQRSAN